MAMPDEEMLTAWEANIELPMPVAATLYAMAKSMEAIIEKTEAEKVPVTMRASLIGTRALMESKNLEIREDERITIYDPPSVSK